MKVFSDKFNYAAAHYEDLSCNLCGKRETRVLSKRDRYGLPVRTVICKNCGLIFINPRMSMEDYNNFYETAYREQLEKYKGTKISFDKLFDSSRRWAREVAERLKSRVNDGLTIEVGSSCGGILSGFKDVKPTIEILGIEPSPSEADYAIRRGVSTHISLFENFQKDIPIARNILIFRSLNHLLDPKRFISWAHSQLAEDGKLIIAVVNFVAFSKERGVLKTQIDHPYMFTPETSAGFVRSGGFEVEYNETKDDYLYLVARKTKQSPFVNLDINQTAYRRTINVLSPRRLFPRYWFRRISAFFYRIKKGA